MDRRRAPKQPSASGVASVQSGSVHPLLSETVGAFGCNGDTLDAATKVMAGHDAFASRTDGVGVSAPDASVLDAVRLAMKDDLDRPKATALLFDTARRANAALDGSDPSVGSLVAAAHEIANVFGLVLGAGEAVPAEVLGQADALDATRAAKDLAAADAIRADL